MMYSRSELTTKLYKLAYDHIRRNNLIKRYKICEAYKKISKNWNRPFCILNESRYKTCFDCPYRLTAYDLHDLDVLDWLNERFIIRYYKEES